MTTVRAELHRRPATPRLTTRTREEGSAYLAVLMLLVVLTILGLSLSVVTQTEVIIGGSEKQSVRQIYQADSTVHLAYAAKLVGGDTKEKMMILARREQAMFGSTTTLGDRVCSSQVFPDQVGLSNLGTINQGKDDYVSAQFAVTANALRHGDDELAARREVGALVGLDPIRVHPGEIVPLDEKKRNVAPAGGLLSSNSLDKIDPCFSLYLRF